MQGWEITVENSFRKIQELLVETKIQLILVNDGSHVDLSHEIKYLNNRIPELTVINLPANKGKGYAIRRGIVSGKSPIQIYTDIDFPYRDENVAEIYRLLSNNKTDIVIGIRENGYYDHVPVFRIWLSKLLRFMVRKSLKIPTSDTQAGLKGFNPKGREIFIKTTINRYLFDLEFITKAAEHKEIKFHCHPITVGDDVVFSKMNWKILFKEAFNFIKILIS